MYLLKNNLNMYLVSVRKGKIKSTRNKAEGARFLTKPAASTMKRLLNNKWEIVEEEERKC